MWSVGSVKKTVAKTLARTLVLLLVACLVSIGSPLHVLAAEQGSQSEETSQGDDGSSGEDGDDAGEDTKDDDEGDDGDGGKEADEGNDGDEGDEGDDGEGEQKDDADKNDEEDPAEDLPAGKAGGKEGDDGEDQSDGGEKDDKADEAGDGDKGGDGDDTENTEEGDDKDEEKEDDTSDGKPSSVDSGNVTQSGSVMNKSNTGDTDVNVGSSTASSSDETASSSDKKPEGSVETTIDTDNDLNSTTTLHNTATTGENAVDDDDGAHITSGFADTVGMIASLFNIVIANSSGALHYLQNPLGPQLDLTERFESVFNSANDEDSPCNLSVCDDLNEQLNILTGNVASLTNELIVRSLTGENDAVSEDGQATIETGDARAFGSIVNIGNLQIIDSRYLIILLENIGDLTGDIIVPPPDFFHQLSSQASVSGNLDIDTENDLDLTNLATTTTDTGDNAGTSTKKGGSIDTGDGTNKAFVLNDANHNSLGGRPVCFIVSVGGTWDGGVENLPENFTREDTPFGEIICGAGQAESTNTIDEDEVKASTTNYAKILNKALVEAKTGGNTAEGEEVSIKTGDAEALVQILNIVNQNIIGQDWIFALFTISGDWKGDLVFGSKEFWDDVNDQLSGWSGGSASGHILRLEDTKLLVDKTVKTEGDIEPGDTVTYEIFIENRGGPAYHSLLIDTLYAEDGTKLNEQNWELGTIAPHEEITVSYDITLATTTPAGIYDNEAYILAVENHHDLEQRAGKDTMSEIAEASIEVIAREEQHPVMTALDDVFKTMIPSASCPKYLTEYIKFGEQNSVSEVAKLQRFLNEYEGRDLEVTGIYDAATYRAVHDFQEKYRADILDPWGMTSTTGYVYYTTQRQINNIYCFGDRAFNLTPEQISEIEKFRARLEDAQVNSRERREDASAEGDDDEEATRETELELMEDMGEVGAADGEGHLAENRGESSDAPARAESEGDRDKRRIAPEHQVAGAAEALEPTRSERLLEALRDTASTMMQWVTKNMERARLLSGRE